MCQNITHLLDLSEVLEGLRLPPDIQVTHCANGNPDDYGWCSCLELNDIWINLDKCKEDKRDAREVIAHELVHLAQFRLVSLDQILHCKSYGYERDPMEVQARQLAPVLAPYVKRAKD